MESTSSPAPGWYANPENPGEQRYWDGRGWTEHVAPLPPPSSAAGFGTSPSDPAHWLLPVGRSGSSIAAGYLGLLCLVMALFGLAPFPGPLIPLLTAGLTISVAVRALKKAKDGGHGRGRAIFGLSCAGIAIIAGLAGLGLSASSAIGTS